MIEVRPKSLLQAQRFPSEMRYAARSNDRFPLAAVPEPFQTDALDSGSRREHHRLGLCRGARIR